LLALWERIICESHVWANENVVGDPETIPKLDATLHSYTIAQDNVILDKNVVADVTIFTNDCSR
jgi:hypothetical protein